MLRDICLWMSDVLFDATWLLWLLVCGVRRNYFVGMVTRMMVVGGLSKSQRCSSPSSSAHVRPELSL